MIDRYVEQLKIKIDYEPEIGIILGSGLGDLGEKIENPVFVNYKDIDGFPCSTAPGHKGRFIFGELSGKKVMCMQGRLHFYEGYPMEKVILPVRVMKKMGVEKLIVTNAAGGINKDFSVGDIMMITDHINFMGINPLVGKNDDIGTRFPDMTYAYSPALRETALACSEATGVQIKQGVYLACSGPSYETPAEIKAFRCLGADAVGMSTVPEVIAANHCGIKVLAFSLICNMAAGILDKPLTEEEVLEAGAVKGKEMQKLICEIIKEI